MTITPDFISIALPLVKRGFRVTPVHPLTKKGILRNLHSVTTVEGVLDLAKYYPNHNVGVVSKRKAGRLMFFDDDSGIAARIEKETGRSIPRTYTVASRPDTNKLKKHFYFRQSEYSFKRFAVFAEGNPWESKNVNRRDMTRLELSESGVLIHPTLYDLKGIGGISFVVAAGSLRESGERYTCIDDSEVAEIPNWLVDWFVDDIRKYHTAKAREKKEKLTERTAQERTLKAIAQEDIYDYLRWRAHSLVGLGLVGEGLEHALTHIAKTDCDQGETFVASEHGKESIHKIAFSNWEPGIATWFYQTGELKSEVLEGHVMIYKATTKQEVLEGIIKTFPDTISTAEVYERLTKGLDEEDFSFDRHKDRSMLWHARKATGFELDGHIYWVRTNGTGTA
jgi:hypothetical protein